MDSSPWRDARKARSVRLLTPTPLSVTPSLSPPSVSVGCPRCGYAPGDALEAPGEDSPVRGISRGTSRSRSFYGRPKLPEDEMDHLGSVTLVMTRIFSVPSSRLIRDLLDLYRVIYVLYLLLFILLGTALLMLVDNGTTSWVSALYLSTSTVTNTGLSPVDFPAMGLASHMVVWWLLILTSPMLMSVVPVILRLNSSRRTPGGMSDEQRLGGAAFYGLPTTADDEHQALRFILRTVVAYWFVCQLLGSLILFVGLQFSNLDYLECNGQADCSLRRAWAATFMSVSVFHNAGLITFKTLPFTGDRMALVTLSGVMLVTLLGNTCYPIALRHVINLRLRLTKSASKQRVLELLLRYPRTCYTHLFPEYATRWLSIVTPLLIVLQIFAFALVDLWAEPDTEGERFIMYGLDWTQRATAMIFQAVTIRTSGMSVLNNELLSPTSAFVMCICMWISTSPVVVVMRTTQRIPGKRALSRMKTISNWSSWTQQDVTQVRGQFSTFMSEHSTLLLFLFFLILLGQEFYMSEKHVREGSFLFILFDFCSSYGTVGLSMSNKPWAQSGEWCKLSQLCLMVVMLLGRLRGLPETVDPSVRFRGVAFEEENESGVAAYEPVGNGDASSEFDDEDEEVRNDF